MENAEYAADAAEAMSITADALSKLGLVDQVITEAPEAHITNAIGCANLLQQALIQQLRALDGLDKDAILDARYQRYTALDQYL